jgi:hypothetical protein
MKLTISNFDFVWNLGATCSRPQKRKNEKRRTEPALSEVEGSVRPTQGCPTLVSPFFGETGWEMPE